MMADSTARLKELLACYGADIALWPEEAQGFGFHALAQPEHAALIEAEKRFERVLRLRRAPAAPSALAQRIIAAAGIRAQLPHTTPWFADLLAATRPGALAAMLAIGFILGFGVSAPSTQKDYASAPYSADDEGAIL